MKFTLVLDIYSYQKTYLHIRRYHYNRRREMLARDIGTPLLIPYTLDVASMYLSGDCLIYCRISGLFKSERGKLTSLFGQSQNARMNISGKAGSL